MFNMRRLQVIPLTCNCGLPNLGFKTQMKPAKDERNHEIFSFLFQILTLVKLYESLFQKNDFLFTGQIGKEIRSGIHG